MKNIKKILNLFVLLMLLVSSNVKAQEVQVDYDGNYMNCIKLTSEDLTCKLTDDFSIGGISGSNNGDQDAWEVYHNVTLDLDGHELDLGTNQLKYQLHSDMISINIIDSSNSGTGKIIGGADGGVINIASCGYTYYDITVNIENVEFAANEYGSVSKFIHNETEIKVKLNITNSIINGANVLFNTTESFGKIEIKSLTMNSNGVGTLRIDGNKNTTLNISNILYNKSQVIYNDSEEVTKKAVATDNIYTIVSNNDESIIIEEREIIVPSFEDEGYDDIFKFSGTKAGWSVPSETKDLLKNIRVSLWACAEGYDDDNNQLYSFGDIDITDDMLITTIDLNPNTTSYDFKDYMISGLQYMFSVQYVDINDEATDIGLAAWSSNCYYKDGTYPDDLISFYNGETTANELNGVFSKLDGTLKWDKVQGATYYEILVYKWSDELEDYDYDNSPEPIAVDGDTTEANISSLFEKDGSEFTGNYAIEIIPYHSYPDLMLLYDYFNEVDFSEKELSLTVDNVVSKGTVTYSPEYGLVEGTLVTVTIEPAFGYMVDESLSLIRTNDLTYINPLTKVNDTTYTFEMPSKNSTLKIAYKADTNLESIDVTIGTDGQLSWSEVEDASYYKFSLYNITSGSTAIYENQQLNKNSFKAPASKVGTAGKFRLEVVAYNSAGKQISQENQYAEGYIIISWNTISSVVLTATVTEPELDGTRSIPIISSSTTTIKVDQAETKWLRYNESTSTWEEYTESKFTSGKYKLAYQVRSGVEVTSNINYKLTSTTTYTLNGNKGTKQSLTDTYSTDGIGYVLVYDSVEYEIIPEGPQQLSTPANITLNSNGTLTWDTVKNANSYTIEVYKGASLQTTLNSETNSIDLLSYLYAGSSYFFKVKAVAIDSESYPESNYGVSDNVTFNGVSITAVNGELTDGNLIPGLVNTNSGSYTITINSTTPINFENTKVTEAKWIYSSDNTWETFDVKDVNTKVIAGYYRPYIKVVVESHGIVLTDTTKLFIDSTEWDLISYNSTGTSTYCYFAGESKEVEKLKDISLATSTEISDSTYTGLEITKDFELKYNNNDLVLDTDYTVSYSDNINAGTAKILITGIGLYEGTKELEFNINPKDLTNNTVEIASEYEYTGLEIKPSLVLKDDDINLIENTDYEITYDNNINVGKAKLTITYINNYQGTKEVEFNIVGININNAVVTGYEDIYYDGTTKTFDLLVKINGNDLVLNTDYKVVYKNNTNCGIATITLTGINNYSGTKEITFKILGKSLVDLDYQDLPTYKYDGTEHKPEVNILDGSYQLKKGIDYELEYSDNIYKGNGVVTVNGINNYSGTKNIEFTITYRDIDNVTVQNIPEQAYSGNEVKPIITVTDLGNELVLDTDYSVTYSNNINRGTATIVITADPNSNYSGTKEVTFEIGQKDIGTVVINKIDDVTYTGDKFEPVIEVYDNGNLLTLGTDYKVTYSNNINAGVAKVLVTALNNYSGTRELTFIINARNIEDSILSSIEDYKFDGNAKKPEPSVTLESHELIKGTDYIISYSNNINVGNATITITGKNNYVGTITKNYVITKGDSIEINDLSKNVVATNTEITETLVSSKLGIPTNAGTVSYAVVNYTTPTNTIINSCEMDGNKLVISMENGTVNDEFTVTINVMMDNYEYSTFDYKFKLIDKYEQKLEVKNTIINKTYGDDEFSNTVKQTGDGTLSYSSTNTDVATVNKNGKVTIVGTGETTIVINASETKNYVGAEVSYTVYVSKKKIDKPTMTSQINYKNSSINPIDYMKGYNSNIMEITTSNYNQNKNVGTYKTKIELTDTDNYEFSDGTTTVTLTWSIIKSDPTFTVPTNLEATIGSTLNDVELPDNFKWNNPDKSLELGEHTYLASYDTGNSNYNVIKNIEITIITSNYSFEWTKNQKVVLKENEESEIKVDAPYELFSHKVEIDGKELVEDVDYFSKEGSTIITLSNQCIENLSEGNHELSIYFTNGAVVTSTLQVKEATGLHLTGIEIIMLILLIILIILIILFILCKKKKKDKKNIVVKKVKK